MNPKNRLPVLFIADVIVLAAIWLSPDPPSVMTLKRALMIILAVLAIILLIMITRRREIQHHVRITEITPVSMINPNQYLSKGGPVCAGSDDKYRVSFLLEDESQRLLSLSAKQAASLARGMRGTLIYHDDVFISFSPEK